MSAIYVCGQSAGVIVDNSPLGTDVFGLTVVPVAGDFVKVQTVQGGVVVLDTAGRLFFRGLNAGDVLPLPGDADTFHALEQLPVPSGAVWTANFAFRGSAIIAIDSLQRLWVMGADTPFAPGDPKGILLIDDTKSWTKCATGGGSYYAVNSAGELWSGGGNENGRLGRGTFSTPLAWGMVDDAGYTDVSASLLNAVAVRFDTDYWEVLATGWNFYGQIGQGNQGGNVNSFTAVWEFYNNDPIRLFPGYTNSVIQGDGETLAAGAPNYFATSAGNKVYYEGVNSTVLGIDPVFIIGTSQEQRVLLAQDGGLWVAGDNTGGAIGREPDVFSSGDFTQLVLAADVISVDANSRSLAVVLDAEAPPPGPAAQFWTGFTKTFEVA